MSDGSQGRRWWSRRTNHPATLGRIARWTNLGFFLLWWACPPDPGARRPLKVVESVEVTEKVRAVFDRAGVTGTLHARQLHSSDTLASTEASPAAACSVGGTEPVVLASVFKIAVAVAFARAVDAGLLDPRDAPDRAALSRRRHRHGRVEDDVEMSWRDVGRVHDVDERQRRHRRPGSTAWTRRSGSGAHRRWARRHPHRRVVRTCSPAWPVTWGSARSRTTLTPTWPRSEPLRLTR